MKPNHLAIPIVNTGILANSVATSDLLRRALVFALAIALPATLVADEFSWKDTPGKHRDLFFGDKPVVRYVYEAIDTSSPERRDLTYKPFYHVYDRDSGDFITKGPGGKYPHHRGIYYGFSKCSYTDADGKEHKGIDTWHCKKAHQVHEKFLEEKADADQALLSTEIAWIDNDGKKIATETRTQIFSFSGNDLVVKFSSTLTPDVPKVTVDGDPQHAGFQFRASNEVAEKTAKQTYYIRPKTGKAEPGTTINWSAKNDTEATRDLPWKAMSFVVGGNRFTTAYLDSPGNPKPARFSERDYGRFGSYFVSKNITAKKPLIVNYTLVIRKGEMTPDEVEQLSKTFLKPN